MKLSFKSLLLLTPLIVIPLLLVGFLAYYQLKNSTEERMNEKAETLLDQINYYTRNKIQVAKVNVSLLADHQLLKKYALTEDESTRYNLLLSHILTIFSNVNKSLPDYYEFRFILPDGYEDAQWSKDDGPNHIEENSQLNYFKAMQNSLLDNFFMLIRDENTLQHAILMVQKIILTDPAQGVLNNNNQLRGYLTITVSLKDLYEQINKYKLGKRGFLAVVDKNGNQLFQPKLQNLPNNEVVKRERLIQSLIKATANFSTGRAVYKTYWDQTLMITHQKELPAGLRLIATMPESDLLDDSQNLGKTVFFIILTTVLLMIGCVYFAIRYLILIPLNKLDDTARAIGQGRLEHEIDVCSNDEIGHLARSFQAMSNNLSTSHSQIEYLANHDSLTGLPNRNMFKNYLKTEIAIARQNSKKLALLFFDLDDFKQVNDAMGHQAGDVLLQELAVRLSGSLRQKATIKSFNVDKVDDMVARLGGDEFVIMLNQISNPMDAVSVAERILEFMSIPITLHNEEYYISGSIGITLFPDDAGNVTDMIKNADIAMYHAKEQGKNNYQFYSHNINQQIHDNLLMKNRIRKSLDNDHFCLFYQPKVNSLSGKIVGMEALIRWIDPIEGMIPPDVFIPVAEKSGLITPLTQWVINEACRQNKRWQAMGLAKIPVAINVSSIQFKRNDLVSMIAEGLENSGLKAEYLEVELTETSLITGTDNAIETLKRLNELGVLVALDDFGTGYSSLSYLHQFAIQILKIDRCFVQTISDNDKDSVIVSAIIAMGHELGLQIVAEGVETQAQFYYLKERKCDMIQGYLFSKPLNTKEFEKVLKKQILSIDLSSIAQSKTSIATNKDKQALQKTDCYN